MSRGDTIARYDTSMDKFSVRPIAKLTPLPAAPVRLDKDLLVKNSVGKQPVIVAKPAGDIRVPGARAEVAARAGRFIFLALALPSYLAFYTLPKLILTGILPFVFQKGVEGIQYTLQHVNKAYQVLVQVLSDGYRTVQGWISWALKGLEGINTSIFGELKRRMAKFRQAIAGKVKKGGDAAVAPVKRGFSWLRALIAKIAKLVEQALQVMISPLKRYGCLAKEKLFLPAYQWISSKLTPIKRLIDVARGLIAKALQPARSCLQKLYHYLLAKIQTVTTPIASLLKSLRQRLSFKLPTLPRFNIRKPTLPKLTLKQHLHTVQTKFIQFAYLVNKTLKNLYHNRNAIIKKCIKTLFRILPIIPIFILIFKWLGQKTLLLLTRLAKRILSLITPYIEPIIRAWKASLASCHRQYTRTLTLLFALYHPLVQLSHLITIQLTSTLHHTSSLLTLLAETTTLSLKNLHSTASIIESKIISQKKP